MQTESKMSVEAYAYLQRHDMNLRLFFVLAVQLEGVINDVDRVKLE